MGRVLTVRNYSKYGDIHFLNPDSQIMTAGEENSNVSEKTNGKFKLIDDKEVALYLFESRLFLKLGDYSKPISEIINMEISTNEKIALRILFENGEKSYITEDEIPSHFPSDPTQLEFEDLSFLVFIYNIYMDKSRQEVLKEAWV